MTSMITPTTYCDQVGPARFNDFWVHGFLRVFLPPHALAFHPPNLYWYIGPVR